MSQELRSRDGLLRLLVPISHGELDEERFETLDELVRTDPDVCASVVSALTHFADLEWEGRGPDHGESISVQETTPLETPHVSVMEATTKCAPLFIEGQRESVWNRTHHSLMIALASFAIGILGSQWYSRHEGERVGLADVVRQNTNKPTVVSSAFPVATLVSHTSVLWDTDAGVAIDAGASLRPGKSVALFEGQAEVSFDDGLVLRMNGPAILSITSQGIAELKYGKAVVENHGVSGLRLELPLAFAQIPINASIGVDAFGDEVVVHTLLGAVTLSPHRGAKQISMTEGEAARLRTDAHSQLGISRSAAAPEIFDFQAMSPSDQLAISPAYARLIIDSDPVGMWRFESIESHVVMDDSGHGRDLQLIGGNVQIVHQGDNGWADFKVRTDAGCFVCPHPFEELAGSDYSLEMWMKPSHFHRGALVSLVEHAADEAGHVERHGLIVETEPAFRVTGERESRSKAIRFLHRSPPHELLGGKSCFSKLPYRVQAWQHVAVVKEKDVMRLYVDGEQRASDVDATQFPKTLQMVVGQLFSFGTVRPFVGQLDELAIYARALSQSEIRQRVDLVRSQSTSVGPAKTDQGQTGLGESPAISLHDLN